MIPALLKQGKVRVLPLPLPLPCAASPACRRFVPLLLLLLQLLIAVSQAHKEEGGVIVEGPMYTTRIT